MGQRAGSIEFMPFQRTFKYNLKFTERIGNGNINNVFASLELRNNWRARLVKCSIVLRALSA